MRKNILCIILVGIITIITFQGCIDSSNYQLKEEIDNIEYAEIADISYYGYAIDNIEVLAKLSAGEAQKLAREICLLKCKNVNPPEYDIKSISAIFYYSDGSYEIISQRSNRYLVNDEPRYGYRVFEYDEFANLLESAIN